MYCRTVDSLTCRQRVRRNGYRLLAGAIRRNGLNRQALRADRQRHFVHRLRRREARNGLAVYLDIRQRIIRQLAYRKIHAVGHLAGSIGRRDKQRCITSERSRLGYVYRLRSILLLIRNSRYTFGTVGQLHRERTRARVEVRYVLRMLLVVLVSIGIGDVRQLRVAALRRHEYNLIGRRGGAVLCANRDGHRSAVHSAAAHRYLAAAQLAARERLGRPFRVRQRTRTAVCLYRRQSRRSFRQ